MADYSIITQDPAVRQYVQNGLLELDFHDALFPELKFRSMVEALPWGERTGDTKIFTGDGLYTPTTRPLPPSTDPVPKVRQKEQWTATIQRFGDTGDIQMATSALAPVDLFEQEIKALGKAAAQSLNRKVRNRLYNAGMAGNTVVDGAGQVGTTLKVKHLNGFTRARRPDLATGSPVLFDAVSANNPLPITVTGIGARNVVGFTPVNAGDEYGPGTLTLDQALGGGGPADRAAVLAGSRSFINYVGGGTRVDDIGNTDLFLFASLRAAVSRLRDQNIPEFPDGFYYMHVDSTTENQFFADAETQRMLTSLPDYVMYSKFAIGNIAGTAVLRNTECPKSDTVLPKDGTTFTLDDDFAGELFNNGSNAGIKLHRPVVMGYGMLKEYWLDYMSLISDAGLQGKTTMARVSSNGIDVMSDRITMIIRPPQNRMQDVPTITWGFMGDWPVRTDATSGDAAAYKRAVVTIHGE